MVTGLFGYCASAAPERAAMAMKEESANCLNMEGLSR
jgi:hypothetical protein